MLRLLPLAIIALAAGWLRTHDLAKRPMHADEANQAVKLGELLDAGRYAFDPRDHHGPTLYYAAVPVAWLRGERSLATLTETTVRLVPAIFGTLTVLLVVALASPLGRWPALLAGALIAVSPPAVYYSRYFIQETLLGTFTLAAVLSARSWWRTGLTRWAVAGGACAGLMQATKASAPLFLAAGLFAWWIARRARSPERKRLETAAASGSRSFLRGTGVAALAALLTAALLYSSFGTHLAGLRDALTVYTNALTRFGAAAAPTGHEKPWWYYLRILSWYREGGLVWQQLAFSLFAVAGLGVAVVSRSPYLRGVAAYTAVIVGAFSFFAYKTPWHLVHFVPGMAILAAAALATLARMKAGGVIATVLAMLVIATLYHQTQRSSFLRPADQRNPYAYVHSAPDVLKVRDLALAAAARFPEKPIRVISEEYWPLPWYLRGLARVGYYAAPPDDCDGALVIASQLQAESVRAQLRGSYRESFLGLRPGFLCIVFTPEP
ncbi:flippase activity-associated protein Agl23 [Horticoccus sp. 23ND18S-11]|uniref:flippase activity-associated protein Agl23 n=1 Tax=Horticoccus sp. 23ND18S-11 TaxID=3391832 RepID=UPI0039C8DE16